MPPSRGPAQHPLGVAAVLLAVAALVGWVVTSGDGGAPPVSPDRVGAEPARSAPAARQAARSAPTATPQDAPARAATGPEPAVTVLGAVVARVLAPDGTAVVTPLRCEASWLPELRLTAQPDDEGRHRVALAPDVQALDDPPAADPLPPVGALATLTFARLEPVRQRFDFGRERLGPGAGAGPRATVSFAWPEVGRDVDLGTVVLEHQPLLVAGTVVDALDRPVETARIWWEAVEPVEIGPGLRRTSTQPCYAVTGDSGRFALHGPRESAGGTLLVHALDEATGARTFDPLEVACGAMDVTVRLVAPSRAEARVVLTGDARMLFVDVSVHGEPASSFTPSSGGRPQVLRERRDDGVAVTLSGVRPGRWNVVFTYAGNQVLVLDGVDFPPGAAATDPRLARVVIAPR